MIRRVIAARKARLLKCRRGVTLIGLLVIIAILSLSAGLAGSAWSVRRQQAREKDLLWRGNQYRRAIASYYNRDDLGKGKQYPPNLQALLEDGRGLEKRQHIRQLYNDPMTGGEWQVIPSPNGGVMGVRSRSALRPFKEEGFSTEEKGFAGAKSYSDWRFYYRPAKASTKTSSSAASPR